MSHPVSVPGEPQNVLASAINSSSVEVVWDPPVEKDKNGVIRGYQIYVKPKNSVRKKKPTLDLLIKRASSHLKKRASGIPNKCLLFLFLAGISILHQLPAF